MNNNFALGKKLYRLQLSPYQINCKDCALSGYADCRKQVQRITRQDCAYRVVVELVEGEE